MAKRRNSGKQQPPDGSIRASQVITTYGPGALVDLVHDAVMIKDMSAWRYPPSHPESSLVITEDRLVASLKAGILREQGGEHITLVNPPIAEDVVQGYGISSLRFPEWFVCTTCRSLVKYRSLMTKGKQYLHDCEARGSVCVPVRFVSACTNGHMDEFPWSYFVHKGDYGDCDVSVPRLTLDEGATGDFSDATVKCRDCERTRRLSEARAERGGMPAKCRGKRPWIGMDSSNDEECNEKVHLVVRNASNTWFSVVESALSIPEGKTRVERAIEEFKAATKIESVGVEMAPLLATIPAFRGISASEIEEAIRTELFKKNRSQKIVTGLREAEHRTYMAVGGDDGHSLSLDDASDAHFAAKLLEGVKLPPQIKRVVQVEKLREVRALVGFSRLLAPPRSMLGQLTERKDKEARLVLANQLGEKLPAVEVFGEGIFIELDGDMLDEWANRPEVIAREEQLQAGFDKLEGFAGTSEFPGIRFYLLHSLAHVLIQELSLECGYAASALRERIYCNRPGDTDYRMHGFLISTGSPGSEGTLGGLVAQAERLQHRLTAAFRAAAICSNDPVCASHDPAEDRTNNSVDGAACHGCLYVSESSCEWFNKQLDRALLIPTMTQSAALAFFEQAEF